MVVGLVLAALVIALLGAWATRGVLLLNLARIVLDRDAELRMQEKADGVAVAFATPPAPWISPMKNVMNPIWQPIGATGVNYYTFAGPGGIFRSYSERSDPNSPYYQAWVGGYVTRKLDGTLPDDLPRWAKDVTELDQRSWLAAMGDPHPLAESSSPTGAGSIVVDGRRLTLWHGTMRSHSDLSERPSGPLATVVGMPPSTSWPAGIGAFHPLTLDGYFVCWSDPARNVSVVVYAVVDSSAPTSARHSGDLEHVKEELLGMMKTARLEPVR